MDSGNSASMLPFFRGKGNDLEKEARTDEQVGTRQLIDLFLFLLAGRQCAGEIVKSVAKIQALSSAPLPSI